MISDKKTKLKNTLVSWSTKINPKLNKIPKNLQKTVSTLYWPKNGVMEFCKLQPQRLYKNVKELCSVVNLTHLMR